VTRRRVRRWTGALVGTVTLTAFGLLFANPTILGAAVIPLIYLLYGTVSGVPDGIALSATRSIETAAPAPGAPVEVTLRVTNGGNDVLPDVRIIDGVPDELMVTAGSPRTCVALSPGESVTLSYTVVAKRGDYQFEDPAVRVRSLAVSDQFTTTVAAEGDTLLTSANTVQHTPLPSVSLFRAGTMATDTGGSGLEFYATRQYKHGDPMNRIDWHHVAKTGEFVTVQYREEQAVKTVLVVDARPVGRVTAEPGYPTGAQLAAYAGERIYNALDSAGVSTTVAAVGLDEEAADGLVGPDGLAWIDPEDEHSPNSPEAIFRTVHDVAGVDARPLSSADSPQTPWGARVDGGTMSTTETGPTGDGTEAAPARTDETTEALLARLPPNAAVILCTPLLDDWPVSLSESLATHGYSRVILSPAVVTSERTGQRVVALNRRLRLRTLERTGTTTVSWQVDQPVDDALRRSLPQQL